MLVISPAIYRFGRISELLPIGFKTLREQRDSLRPHAAWQTAFRRQVQGRATIEEEVPSHVPAGQRLRSPPMDEPLAAGIARMDSSYTEALVIGAGPAGLFAACELLRHGIRPRIVERRLEPHVEARGTALQPATLEMFERAGLARTVPARGRAYQARPALGPGLREIARKDFSKGGSVYEFQCSLPQWRTEAILRDHLSSLGLEIEFGTEVTSIDADPGAVRVVLESGGRRETVTAAYVLGAGGGHSVTRHSMHEHLDGRPTTADISLPT